VIAVENVGYCTRKGLARKMAQCDASMPHSPGTPFDSKCKFITDVSRLTQFQVTHCRNNRHHAQICATALFYILAPICFGSSLPSSGSFWIRLSYMKMRIDLVVYLKYITDKNQCVKHIV
jgi:hypothetical protein